MNPNLWKNLGNSLVQNCGNVDVLIGCDCVTSRCGPTNCLSLETCHITSAWVTVLDSQLKAQYVSSGARSRLFKIINALLDDAVN